MKKIYSLLGLALITASVSTAQVDIKDFNPNSETVSGNNLNGTTITRTVSDDELIIVQLGVVNKSGSDKIYDIVRDKIVDVAAWSGGSPAEQICWGPIPQTPDGICLEPNSDPWRTPNSFTLSNNGLANLKFDIHSNGPGTIHYRFYVMEATTKIDSVDVYLTTTLSIKEKKNEEVSLSVYPNPVSNAMTVTTQGLSGNFDIKITDVLGKVVYNENVNGISKKLDVSDFKNGVYLVTILEKGLAVQTRRVVIKH